MLYEIMLIILIILVIGVFIVGWIKDNKKVCRHEFNAQHPVGCRFYRHKDADPFPYGKWILIREEKDGWCLYERVKTWF